MGYVIVHQEGIAGFWMGFKTWAFFFLKRAEKSNGEKGKTLLFEKHHLDAFMAAFVRLLHSPPLFPWLSKATKELRHCCTCAKEDIKEV